MNSLPTFRLQPVRRLTIAGRAGFTLVEMLTVMSIIVILLALAVPTIRGLSANQLGNSGRLFTNLLTVARSEAINRRTIVRVEVATVWPDARYNYRKFTLTAATLNVDGTAYFYRQIGGWETIPDGVIFETNDPALLPHPADGSVYVFAGPAATPLGDQGGIAYEGVITPTVYIAFSPSGGLVEKQPPNSISVPVRARLTEGNLSGTAMITHTRGAANWLDVRVNHLTGRVEVGRPDSPLL